nr:ankyrin repeat, bromo and BTB domain-containing protein DDB_G0293800 [Ipomoea batatas]
MSKLTEAKKKSRWSTWEELLLAFAVKRHGLKDWESVAMEVRTRTSLPDLLTAQVCREKYRDLHRRFMNSEELAVDVDAGGGGGVDIPWLEKLRQLRVTELKQEVHCYDLSIQSLQLKVKRMEEERDHSLKESQNDAVKPDLEEDRKEKRSENDEKNGDGETPEKVSGKSVSVTESEHENRSFNESNSTENRGTEEKAEPLSIEGGETKPDPQTKPVGEEDSCNDSSDRREESNRTQDRKSENELAAETRDSVGASKDSSDVQSTASLTKRRRKRADLRGGDGGNVATAAAAAAASPATATKRESAVKSEPFVGLLDIIRSRKHASMFERRLDSQKTERYKSMIRRHVDFGTVQARIDDGFYSGCPMSFYLDLLLLFNNAVVFFPKSSPEWRAAQQLRDIVTKELRNYRSEQPSSAKVEPEQPKQERPDNSLVVKQKSTAPIVVCRKRSSFSGKAAGSGNKQENEKPPLNPKTAGNKSSPSTPPEDDSLKKTKPNEKPVTGVRSMRRTTKGRPAANAASQSTNVKKSGGTTTNKPEASKMEEETSSIDKKRGAADFLKRIKKNSATKDTLVDNSSSSKRVQQKRKPGTEERRAPPAPVKEAKVVENSPSKRSVGRPAKRGREAATSPPAGKRGKETNSASKEGSSKRPQKRSRR